MLMLLSPAKSLVEGPAVAGYDATQPALLPDAELLMETTRPLKAADLERLEGIPVDIRPIYGPDEEG